MQKKNKKPIAKKAPIKTSRAKQVKTKSAHKAGETKAVSVKAAKKTKPATAALVQPIPEEDKPDFSWFYNSLVLEVEEFTAFISDHSKVCTVVSYSIDDQPDARGLDIGVDIMVFNYTEHIPAKSPYEKPRTESKKTFFVCYTIPDSLNLRLFRRASLDAATKLYYDLDKKYQYEKQRAGTATNSIGN